MKFKTPLTFLLAFLSGIFLGYSLSSSPDPTDSAVEALTNRPVYPDWQGDHLFDRRPL